MQACDSTTCKSVFKFEPTGILNINSYLNWLPNLERPVASYYIEKKIKLQIGDKNITS